MKLFLKATAPMKMNLVLIVQLVTLLCLESQVDALDNGLALTPPMGWLSWTRFGW
jgi:hypothetical protein